MSDKYSNGLQWENLTLRLSDLFSTLIEVTGASPIAWQPMQPSTGVTRESSDAWQKIEANCRDRIHEATRALIKTACMPDRAPEIVYFLGLRLLAALNHVEAMIAVKDERPMSLCAFPALPPDEVIEWLLTEWADDHAIMIVFPTPDVPSAGGSSASPLFVSSF